MVVGLILAASAWLNRFAGGGWPGHLWDTHNARKLPGRALYPATVGIGLVAALVQPWQVAIGMALAFIVWRSPAWGLLISLGRQSGASSRPPHWFEALLLRATGGNVHIALFMRHLIMIAPGLALVSFVAHSPVYMFAPVFAALATLAYKIAWRLTPQAPIRNAEIAIGVMWGAMILGV